MSDYDTLYTLLQNAIEKNKSVSDKLTNIIIDIPNDVESVKEEEGDLLVVKIKKKWNVKHV